MGNKAVNKIREKLLAERTVKSLRRRNFEAYYAEDCRDALEISLSLIGMDDSISFGGSVTVADVGIIEALKERGNRIIDRDSARTPEERQALMREALTADTFIMSSNAISADGVLINIDGIGNRVAALIYGPKSVIVLAGINKVTADIESAHHRAHTVAAPTNAQRFDIETPCRKDGCCHDCISDGCICCQIVETRMCRPKGRIKVIIIGEDLGM